MGKNAQLFRQDRPPTLGKVITVIKIDGSRRFSLTILSAAIAGYWTHWDGQRTVGCYGDHKQCTDCKKGLPRRWKGFLHCIDNEYQTTGFVELTPLAAERLMNRMPEGEPLRGMRIILFRERAGKKSPIAVEIIGQHPDQATLPKAADPEKTCQRLWGATHLS